VNGMMIAILGGDWDHGKYGVELPEKTG